MEAFEYFGGLTRVALTDRMKSVLLEMEENKPRWNPRFADAHGFHWSCGTRLQAVHAPNKRVDCILHSFRMIRVSFDICEHSSQEHAHRAGGRPQSHAHWCDTEESALLVPSP
jgi:hypothetical protein